ncbi:methyltransferase-like protein 25B isoform X1 [Vanessa cardui]|uniref:methyltransferase-like protein 25B isoform X1 n=1 Tax=Vanessa cardui TaxID=171605 RepID=UPI001F144FF4|nr:methyltransferase-like protein 25B isoform X1 [Vanessa cardui]
MRSQEDTVKTAANMCLKVIKMYEWLLNLYVLDFFVDNHWIKLPMSWQRCFGDMDPKDLGDIITGEKSKSILPLSFLALLKAITCLNIPRTGYFKYKILNQELEGNIGHPKLKNLYLKHVKLKKRHEISLMSDFVYSTAMKSECNAVLDFGSGLGHLVRILNYKYNLSAVGIEMQTQLTEEARKLDLEFEYTAKKHLTDECMSNLLRPTHCNVTLTSLDQLHQIPLPNNAKRYGLIGLHPCGDLGPLLIKHFVKSDKVKFICVVGCCYMKLSCNSDSCGYPMSRYVRELDNSLTYVSREIACHAIESYCQKLCRGDYKDLKVHAYRAALEKLLVEMDPEFKHMPIRSVKHTNDMSFESYCEAALQHSPLKSLQTKNVEEELKQWKRVVVLYTLRLMIAPLVETVILLDRLLYILEHGIPCAIYPVFDPKISPRNHIIVGIKS